MPMSIPVLMLSMLLFFVLFFGIGFLLNMLLRTTWVMVMIFPIITFLIVGNAGIIDYVKQPTESFTELGSKLTTLGFADILILSTGLAGAFISGIVIRILRKSGYQMF